MRVLLATHTFAFWGGLQDWAVGMAQGLASLGVEVGFVTNNTRMLELATPHCIASFLVDWGDWHASVAEIEAAGPWDVTFSQPFGSRALGVFLKSRNRTPLVVMLHGNNSDMIHSWSELADGILLASESLRGTAVDFGCADPRRVAVLPNGVPDEFFDQPITPFAERVSSDGDARVILAARLAVDKVNQIPATELLVETCLENPNIRTVTIDIFGGGPMRGVFESRLGHFAGQRPRVVMNMRGWVDVDTVRTSMRHALFTVVGGVSGAQGVSLGTACLGAGIRCVVGMTTPENKQRVLATNFGDHSVWDASRTEIARDVRWLLETDNYDSFQDSYVPLMRGERTHTAVAKRAYAFLERAIAGATMED